MLPAHLWLIRDDNDLLGTFVGARSITATGVGVPGGQRALPAQRPLNALALARGVPGGICLLECRRASQNVARCAEQGAWALEVHREYTDRGSLSHWCRAGRHPWAAPASRALLSSAVIMGRRDGSDDLLWSEVGDVLVILHGRSPPTDERWKELVFTASRPLPDGGRAPKAWSAVLIYSLGGMPTVTRRAKLSRMLTVVGQAPPVALVSDSPVPRGILTAVRWLFPAMQFLHPFAPEQRATAVQSLRLEPELSHGVDHAIDEMLDALRQG